MFIPFLFALVFNNNYGGQHGYLKIHGCAHETCMQDSGFLLGSSSSLHIDGGGRGRKELAVNSLARLTRVTEMENITNIAASFKTNI